MQKHHRNSLWLSIFLIFIAVISIPAIHLIRTKINEHQNIEQLPTGYRDDASHLNKTKVSKIVDIETDPQAIQKQLQALLHYAQKNHLKISISGAKHSMGGHTIYPDGIALNMLPYNHMNLDEKNNILTIGSGATWEQALQYLDKYGKSIAVMQSFSNFSIGGSISVNGHGWQKSAPPISSTVESFTLMKANGEIVKCSRVENPELFKLVIGGYGLFGIVFRGSVESEYGKRLRWDLESSLNSVTPYSQFSRNEILSEDASLIENKDQSSTDLLHEYFIPKQNLAQFIQDIKPVLQDSKLDLLNITIREVKQDNDAFMSYARTDVFGLVFLFNQKKTTEQEQQMQVLTNQLVDLALKNHGTFYLPYRLHISREKMRLVYPQVDEFFKLKKKYDPKKLFSNQFYLHYHEL